MRCFACVLMLGVNSLEFSANQRRDYPFCERLEGSTPTLQMTSHFTKYGLSVESDKDDNLIHVCTYASVHCGQ